jgi:hypothetical protein
MTLWLVSIASAVVLVVRLAYRFGARRPTR